MTEVYFMRHSETLKWNNVNNSDSIQLQNEKWPLTVFGENLAKEKSELEEFKNFDVVFSSNYVRAIATAKYFTDGKVYIDESFSERRFGVDSWDELPSNFEIKQFEDFNYKMDNGESINDVIRREEKAFFDILKKYENKKILIVGHATAMAGLFSKWCEVSLTDDYKFNGKAFFDGKWGYCEMFKLSFEGNKLVNIENIR